jgi:hypothetical protein
MMKKYLQRILLPLLASSAAFAAEAPAPGPSPSDDGIRTVRASTGLEERTYERIKGPYTDCVSDVMDLKYEQTGDNVVIHLGERFVFADLGHASYSDSSSPDCKVQVDNVLGRGLVRQTTRNTCADPAQSFRAVQELKLTHDRLSYSYSRQGNGPKNSASFVCVFKPQARAPHDNPGELHSPGQSQKAAP